jgi:hypothetical protein
VPGTPPVVPGTPPVVPGTPPVVPGTPPVVPGTPPVVPSTLRRLLGESRGGTTVTLAMGTASVCAPGLTSPLGLTSLPLKLTSPSNY